MCIHYVALKVISEKLSQSGFDSAASNELLGVIENVSDPFTGLESVYLQDKFITQELGCIVSFKITSRLN